MSGLLTLISPFCMASRTYTKLNLNDDQVSIIKQNASSIETENHQLVEVRSYYFGPKAMKYQLHYEPTTA